MTPLLVILLSSLQPPWNNYPVLSLQFLWFDILLCFSYSLNDKICSLIFTVGKIYYLCNRDTIILNDSNNEDGVQVHQNNSGNEI